MAKRLIRSENTYAEDILPGLEKITKEREGESPELVGVYATDSIGVYDKDWDFETFSAGEKIYGRFFYICNGKVYLVNGDEGTFNERASTETETGLLTSDDPYNTVILPALRKAGAIFFNDFCGDNETTYMVAHGTCKELACDELYAQLLESKLIDRFGRPQEGTIDIGIIRGNIAMVKKILGYC